MSVDNRFTAVALIVILLGAGLAIGVGVDRTWLRPDRVESGWRGPPAPPFETRVAHFRERLGLSDEQAAQVEAILDTAQVEATSIHERLEPEMRAVRDRARTRMRAVLTPEQVAEYDRMSQEFEQKFERRMRGMRGGRGHGGGPGRHGGRGGKGADPGGWPGGSGQGSDLGSGDRPPRLGPDQRFEQLDLDHDGKLSRVECQTDHPFARRMLHGFEEIDGDGDGGLSPEEVEQYRQQRRGGPR